MKNLKGNGENSHTSAHTQIAASELIEVPIINTGGLALCLCGYLAGYPYAGSTITGYTTISTQLVNLALSLRKANGTI